MVNLTTEDAPQKEEEPFGLGCALDYFAEFEEVFEMIDNLKNLIQAKGSVQEKAYEKFSFILTQYVEQPHLLDSQLDSILQKFIQILRNNEEPIQLKHVAFSYMAVVVNVRGYKDIVKHLPHEVADFEPVLCLLESQDPRIGEAIAKLLVRNGVIVVGVARRGESVREHAKKLLGEKGVLHAYECDLTKQDEILRTFKKITTELGSISILINNAGVLKVSGIIDGDIEKWKAVIDTNVMAVATGIREAVASIKAHNIKGHIININSTAGHTVVDFPNAGFYPASKFAVTALTESVRLEINREKLPIKITSLSPGYVETDIVKVAFSEVSGNNNWDKITVKGLHARDIADAALYVLSTPEHVNVKELTVMLQGRIARRVEHVRQHAQELAGEKESLHGYQCDLTKKDEILAAFKKITAELGPISILINNAGTIKMTGIIEGDIEKWQAVVDTNLLAAAICIREAVASMKANSIKGHLININSTAGHIVPDYPKFGFYPSTKFGLRALTETVRLEINREKLPIKITLAFGEFAKEETWSAITAKGLDVIDIANAVLYVLNTPEHVNVTELTVVRQGSAV
ncbi:hypothetical protein HUJ04_010057 [Dendroctonus ponderosae]|nr:hypothetical protein HUJ04_010057 [Dendroctonus ponderosae]